ncbi:secreted RxLR effector protein 161-like [Salvia miltiorrhiza]|uniref:secreted RxLR effector protein 161-like n=1 Tax=Salvia miltiorrhiza TaxID=226208 RepID=UPI0025AC88E7|nr:secreted RxLR effector protein 161-like [Salvia miltiorrhiza]
MTETREVSVLIAQHFKISTYQRLKTEAERKEMSYIPYANIVGSIMYTMICTRPNVAHAISVASRYMSDHGKTHWQALKWILSYMKSTEGYGIVLKINDSHQGDALIGFCDSDYAANVDTRKSQSGYVFNSYGSAISWKSSLQLEVHLSTTEAEYIAFIESVKKSIWLKGIIKVLGIEQSSVGVVKVKKVATEHNAADMLTKSLPATKFRYCLELLDILDLNPSFSTV